MFRWRGGNSGNSTESSGTTLAIRASTPSDGATNIALNSKVIISFNKAMSHLNEASISKTSFLVRDSRYSLVNGNFNFIGQSIVFTPTHNLSSNTKYTVEITKDLKDSSGKGIASSYSFSFTTTNGPVNLSGEGIFSILSTNPQSGATLVHPKSNILVVFSGNADEDTLNTSNIKIFNDLNEEIGVNISNNKDSIIINPVSDLNINSSYKLTLSRAIKDRSNNILNKNYEISFTTQSNQDSISPTVMSMLFPQSDVELSQKLEVLFSEPIKTPSSSNVYIQHSSTNTIIDTSINVEDSILTLKPLSPLQANSTYKLIIKDGGIKDSSNNALSNGVSHNFQTKNNIGNNNPTQPASISFKNITNNSIGVSWTPSTDSDGTITRYYISYKKKSGQWSSEESTTSREHTFSNLEVGTEYYVRVRAKDNSGLYSTYKISSKAKTTSPGESPTQPLSMSPVNISFTSIKMSWGASVDSDGVIDKYYVSYQKSGGKWSGEKETTSREHTFSSLDAGTEYYFRVRAKDNDGLYSPHKKSSKISTNVISGNGTPTQPPSINIDTITANSIKISWNASTDSDGTIIRYYASYKKKDGTWSGEATTTSREYTFSSLDGGTEYYVRVRAKDNDDIYSPYKEIGPISTEGTVTLNIAITQSKNSIKEGEALEFKVSQEVGSIASYSWKSNKDGVLSTEKKFSISSLSLGNHIITCTVTDNSGDSHTKSLLTIIIQKNYVYSCLELPLKTDCQ